MGKSNNQKLKLISLLKILEEKTDENHKLNTTQLIDELAKDDIIAERKSIYADIEALKNLGYDIDIDKSRNGGYYMASRPIEKHEMVILVDAIASSKFITLKKSSELIAKLEKQLSIYDAAELKRVVFVQNRIKQDNESIYYVVDEIQRAISLHKVINFKYCEYNIKKELVPRHDGRIYSVSPLSLVWMEEKYYLVGIDNSIGEIRHYRVDKIKDAICTDDKAAVLERGHSFDIAQYSKSIFGMFGGDQEIVDLSYNESMLGVMIDRFGKDISIYNKKDGNLHSRVEVSVSNQFFGWITGLGGSVKIDGPQSVIDSYRTFLTKSMESYY